MFDSTHRWFSEVTAAKLKERMRCLTHDALHVFAIGCATHAKDCILTVAQHRGQAAADLAQYAPSADLLDRFWNAYPASVSGKGLSDAVKETEQVVMATLGPQPDMLLTAPGAEPLMWAVLYSVASSASDDQIVSAWDALDMSYRAVFQFFSDDPSALGTERMYEVEEETSQCREAIEFQLRFLAAVESFDSTPPSYSQIVAQLS